MSDYRSSEVRSVPEATVARLATYLRVLGGLLPPAGPAKDFFDGKNVLSIVGFSRTKVLEEIN